MSSTTALLLGPLIPAVGAGLVVLFGKRPNLREAVSILTGVALLGVVLSLLPETLAGARPRVDVFEILPGLALAFSVEPLGLLFALVASGLWIATTCYAIGYMRAHDEPNQTRFFACFALAICGALGVALAANLLTLFLFYEMLTLSTYPLVTHNGDERAKRGGRTYLGILMTTSIAFLLFAIIWTWNLTGTLDFRPGGILEGHADDPLLLILLGLFAFGTGKAALMPFHRWLPAAMVAPTPVSALLHAVAVVKAGVFTILKIVVYVFGIDLLAARGTSEWLMWVAGATVLLASLIALTKDNLKARLAYSTVSQLSYIVLGAALATPHAIVGGGMHIAMHALGKITLFFCAGAIYISANKTEISDMRGLGWRMPVTMGAFLIGSLSVIGLPPLGGTWSKWYLALGAAEAGQAVFVAVLMVSSLLNIAYLMPIPVLAFFAPSSGERPTIQEAPLFCVVPLCVTALGCVVMFFVADDLYRFLLPIVGPLGP